MGAELGTSSCRAAVGFRMLLYSFTLTPLKKKWGGEGKEEELA